MKKSAIVTGGAGGIGYAVVKQLIEDGYAVMAMDMAPVESVAERFNLPDVAYVQGNLVNSDDRQRALNTTLEHFGTVDILVNVAGVAPQQRADLLDMTEESFDFVVGVNTKGTLFMTQLVAKQMIAQQQSGIRRGVIVNISSMSAYTSSTNRGEYCVSKAGVSMLTTLFADRLAADNIGVYEVRPGIIATNMTSTVQQKYDTLIEGGLLPISRWGLPEDVAGAVSVLCSDKLAYCTGEVINVDGGFHLRRL